MNKTIGITLVVMAAAIAGTFVSQLVHTAFAQTSISSISSATGNSVSAGAATGSTATSSAGASHEEGSAVTCVGSNGVGTGQTIFGGQFAVGNPQSANSGCQH